MTPSNDLKLVVDTNVLLVSIPARSPYHWFFQSLIQGRFQVFVTTEILSEYEEIIGNRLSPEVAAAVINTLIEAENVFPVVVHFKYPLIIQDPDDDKFANCAINTNADYIVTHDKHFDVLKKIEFPIIKTITLLELKLVLDQ